MNHRFGEMGDVWKHLPLAEMRACGGLGRALERIGEEDLVEGNDPERPALRVIL